MSIDSKKNLENFPDKHNSVKLYFEISHFQLSSNISGIR